MTPNRYTELFFLDEATGLAAGHRPCFECRRGRFVAFRDAWTDGNCRGVASDPLKVRFIDDQLHSERVGPNRSKRTYTANIADLPDGVIVTIAIQDAHAYLIWGDQLLAWSAGGYRERQRKPREKVVTVLTPESTVNAIRSGYVPEVHSSAW